MTNRTFIESRNNKIIKSAMKLKEKKYRTKEKSYLVEGFRLIEEALKAGMKVTQLFYIMEKEEEFSHYIEPYLTDEKVFTTTPEIIAQLSNTKTPQGIIAILNIPSDWEDKISSGSFNHSIFIYADGLQDPGNLGTLIRSAHASGAEGVIIGPNTVDPYSDKVIRSSMGSIFHLPLFEDSTIVSAKLEELGFTYAITSLDGSKSVFQEDLTKNIILVIGNEGKGISEKFQGIEGLKLKIPMPGGAESLNASVAASVILFERVRQLENLYK